MGELQIDSEFQAKMVPLPEEQRAALEDSIKSEGCRDAILTWQGVIVDGHNRYEICTRLEIPYQTSELDFEDRESALDWIDKNQLARRNLNEEQYRYYLGCRYNRVKNDHGGDRKSSGHCDHLKTAQSLAEEYGTGEKTVRRAGEFAAEIDQTPELKEAFTNGEPLKKKRQELKAKKRESDLAEKTRQSISGDIELKQGSAFLMHEAHPDKSIDLLITDPPYSTDVDDIEAFVKWIDFWLPKVADTGRAYIFIGAYPEELQHYLNQAAKEQRLKLDNILVWTYRNTIGPQPSHGYKLNWQACLYFYGPDAPPLDCPSMVENFSVQDINAPDARTGVRLHAWQKPDEIAERLIRHASKEGDLVVDPFNGTGTFASAAATLGRNAVGYDSDPEMLEIARRRGLEVSEDAA